MYNFVMCRIRHFISQKEFVGTEAMAALSVYILKDLCQSR